MSVKPSNPRIEIPGHKDNDPTHDSLSAWLLRSVQVPGFAEKLLAAASPKLRGHHYSYEGVELEVLIGGGERGFMDARIDFSEEMKLWIEIKPNDIAIGDLLRQVKMYRYRLGKEMEMQFWLVIMPYCSQGAREMLTHAGIGVYLVPDVPRELKSLWWLREGMTAMDYIPDFSQERV
jgi:hypothetical protein